MGEGSSNILLINIPHLTCTANNYTVLDSEFKIIAKGFGKNWIEGSIH